MPSIISSAAEASLALGIGSVLAMFTLVNSVLLRPLVIIAAATMVMPVGCRRCGLRPSLSRVGHRPVNRASTPVRDR